jgi:bifunctional ADP-heptose synthase (sugar kinase/adenylyltransferase)
VKGGDYEPEDMPEAEVVARWGGRVALVPFLEGRSSSHLIREVAAREL